MTKAVTLGGTLGPIPSSFCDPPPLALPRPERLSYSGPCPFSSAELAPPHIWLLVLLRILSVAFSPFVPHGHVRSNLRIG